MKMFEQENWWLNAKDHGEKIPPVNIDGLVVVDNGNQVKYITNGIKNDKIDNLYNGYQYTAEMVSGGWAVIEDPTSNIMIQIWENGKNWKTYSFKDLPQEIKDKLWRK